MGYGWRLVESVGPRIPISVLFAKGRLRYKQSTSFPVFCVLCFFFQFRLGWDQIFTFFCIKSLFSKMKISKNDSNTSTFNPFTPRSDQFVNSPCNFHTLSSRQVMRIKKNLIN